MSIPVLSNNSVVRNMQFRIKNVWAEPCFCETDNRWFICQTKANKFVKFGCNASTVKVHYRYVWASTQHLAWWPYCSKKDSGLGVERSSACGGGWTYLSLSENLSNSSSFQLVCIFTCSHSLHGRRNRGGHRGQGPPSFWADLQFRVRSNPARQWRFL